MAAVTKWRGFSLIRHQAWEDGASMILGVLVILSPWLSGAAADSTIVLITGVAGIIIIAMAGMELTSLGRWEEVIEFLCGAWLVASPFVFAYTGPLMAWHVALGALVALLAIFEFWQDWGRKLES